MCTTQTCALQVSGDCIEAGQPMQAAIVALSAVACMRICTLRMWCCSGLPSKGAQWYQVGAKSRIAFTALLSMHGCRMCFVNQSPSQKRQMLVPSRRSAGLSRSMTPQLDRRSRQCSTACRNIAMPLQLYCCALPSKLVKLCARGRSTG